MAKEKNEKRFIKVYSEGVFGSFQVFVDRETGVNYLWRSDGNAGGLCPLIDAMGNPVVTAIKDEDLL
jgi:hypothetical protein